jgi:hypothetical protein
MSGKSIGSDRGKKKITTQKKVKGKSNIDNL